MLRLGLGTYKLSEATIAALVENEVDGPTLVTLDKEELSSELGIRSLPARRYLWDLILKVRSQQNASDLVFAVETYKSEIESAASVHFITPTSSISEGEIDGARSVPGTFDPLLLDVLRSDAEVQRQRQVLDDHLLAHRMQAGTGIGEQVFSDSLVAMREQARLDELQIRTEYDRQYAVSLAPNRDANLLDPSTNDSPIRNLFALCVEACVKNKINVSEALLNGQVRVQWHWLQSTRKLFSWKKRQALSMLTSSQTFPTVSCAWRKISEDLFWHANIPTAWIV